MKRVFLYQNEPLQKSDDGRYSLTSSNHYCNHECIDQNLIWCPEPRSTWGKCYQGTPLSDESADCSSKAPQESKGLRYWACPHRPDACGDEEVFLAGAGSIEFNRGSNFLKDGTTCRYKVMFSDLANKYDKI
jgi:hypothetical protein